MRCVACHHQNLTRSFTASDINQKPFSYFTCDDCLTLQISEVNDDLLNYAYSTSYYGGDDQKFKWPFSILFSWGKRKAAQQISRLNVNKHDKILDVGCGTGEYLLELYERGFTKLWGNEIHIPSQASELINWVPGKFDDIELHDEKFKLISAFHVFEHLQNPKEGIKKIKNLLSEEGTLVLSLPNWNSKQAQKHQANWLHLDPPRHLHLIPPQQLKKIIELEGFDIVSESYNSLFYNTFGHIQSWLNQRSGKRDFLYEFLKKGSNASQKKEYKRLIFHLLFAAFSFPIYALFDLIETRNRNAGTIQLVCRLK